MSAYLVEKETIDKVSFLLKRQGARFQTEKLILEAFGVKDENGLGQKLWDMNRKAVNQRYNEKRKAEKYVYKFCFNIEPVQSFKAMQCLLYQCSEGNVPKSKTYKTLELFVCAAARGIVENLKAYETAKWG
jgi:hypothetical protein